MLKESTKELKGRKSHRLPSLFPGILISKSNLPLIDGKNAVVRDGDAMDIACEVSQHLVGSLHRGFRKDHPVLFPYVLRKSDLGQGLASQSHELSPEDGREGFEGNEVVLAGREPGAAIRRKGAARDEEVGVGMKTHGLSPSMEDTEETDGPSQKLGVPSQGHQGLGGGPHQAGVENFLVGSNDLMKRFRQGEDDMEVENRKKLFPSFFQPSLCIVSVTGGAGTAAAGVVGVSLVTTFGAPDQVAAEGGGPARGEVSNRTSMAGQNALTKPTEIVEAIATKDVAHGGHIRILAGSQRSAVMKLMLAVRMSWVFGVR